MFISLVSWGFRVLSGVVARRAGSGLALTLDPMAPRRERGLRHCRNCSVVERVRACCGYSLSLLSLKLA